MALEIENEAMRLSFSVDVDFFVICITKPTVIKSQYVWHFVKVNRKLNFKGCIVCIKGTLVFNKNIFSISE